jgi:hypothetical protein
MSFQSEVVAVVIAIVLGDLFMIALKAAARSIFQRKETQRYRHGANDNYPPCELNPLQENHPHAR